MVFHKTIGDGPARVAVIPGWFGDHRAYQPMFDDLDVKRFTLHAISAARQFA